MSILRGARELGLRTEWRYGFLGQDDSVAPTPGVLFLELGGRVEPGVLDHHGGQLGSTCAAEVVFRHREAVYNHLLEPWLMRFEEGRLQPGTPWSPTIVVHRDPDWDSVVATWLAQKLVEDGDFPPEAAALVKYTFLVDQGLMRLLPEGAIHDWDAEYLGGHPDLFAPHAGYLALQNVERLRGRHEEQLRLGLQLVDRVIADLRGERIARHGLKPIDFRPSADHGEKEPRPSRWTSDGRFAEAVALLRSDAWEYEKDRSARRQNLEEVLVPTADGREPVRARAFVLDALPSSRLVKYWVRAEGFPFFLCPHPSGSNSGGRDERGRMVYPRVIVSLDPGWKPEGRTPTLRGLGIRLEEKEVEEREKLGGGTDDRGRPPRYAEPWCRNADPWYDGRGHEWTIVDSPISGTVLPYDEIVDIATGGAFWKVPLMAATAVVVRRGESVTPGGDRIEADDGTLFTGAAPTLHQYAQACRSEERPAPDLPVREGLTRRRSVRHVPAGSGFSLEVTRVDAQPGATLEDFVEEVEACRRKGTPPDYTFVRLRVEPRYAAGYFCPKERLSWLLGRLDDSGEPPTELTGEGEIALFGGRSLCLSPAIEAPGGGPDSDVEIFLYPVCLNEALAEFSRRIAGQVPEGEIRPADAGRLQEDFLRFQTKYYQTEVSRFSRGRRLSSFISETLHLTEHYREVQEELDRLSKTDERRGEENRRAADTVLCRVLFVVAVIGALQTVLGLLAWNGSTLRTTLLAVCSMGILVVARVLYARANRLLRGDEPPRAGGGR